MSYQEMHEEEKIDLISIIEKFIKIIKKFIQPLLALAIIGMMLNVGYNMFTHTPTYASQAMFIVSLSDGKAVKN